MDDEVFSRHIGWRAWTTAFLVLGWLLFIPIWWYRLGAELEDAQRMAVVMLSILIFFIAILAIWVPWSMHYSLEPEQRIWEGPEFRFRFWISTVVIFGCIAVLTYGMWRYGRGEEDGWLGPVVIFVLLGAYGWLLLAPADRLYEEKEKEE